MKISKFSWEEYAAACKTVDVTPHRNKFVTYALNNYLSLCLEDLEPPNDLDELFMGCNATIVDLGEMTDDTPLVIKGVDLGEMTTEELFHRMQG